MIYITDIYHANPAYNYASTPVRPQFDRAATIHDQWLKWSCETGGRVAHLTKPGWSKPHTHSPPN